MADTSTADSTISSSIRSFLETGLVFASSIAVIMALLPSFLPVAVALLLFYVAIGRGYRRASADLRRLENKYRSPLFTLIGECFAGLHVVRAFGKTSVYLGEMYQSCDRYAVAKSPARISAQTRCLLDTKPMIMSTGWRSSGCASASILLDGWLSPS